MSLNQELIRTRCQEIEESLSRLERIKLTPKEDFLKDQDLQDIACYRLLVAIEAALGLCYHVAAKRLKKVPGKYAECFAILADAGIIPTDLSERLQKMARVRRDQKEFYPFDGAKPRSLGRGRKRRSGSTLSNYQPSGWGVEGLT